MYDLYGDPTDISGARDDARMEMKPFADPRDQRERPRSSRPSGATDTVYRARGPGGWDGQVGLQSL